VEPATGSLGFELLPEELCIVFYKGVGDAPAERWNGYVDLISAMAHHGSRLRFLVQNDDGQVPTAVQTRASDLMRGHTPRVAMLSSATSMRFIVSAVVMWNPQIRLFAPSELDAALAHLNADAKERSAFRAALDRVRTNVGR
jgi:hypothetical protein